VDPTVSVFIPAYNAAATIRSVIDRVPPRLWRRLTTLWIVNDGSTDATGAVIEALARKNEVIHPVQWTANRGYGAAVREGLALCRNDGCDFAACVHADGQYPPEAVLDFVEALSARRVDLMQGSRIASGTALSGGMPLYKYIAGKCLTMLENATFGLNLTDYHSGFLVYSKKCLDTLPFHRLSTSFDFDLEVIASARARRLAIGELPIPTRYAGEKSYLNPIGYGLRVLRVLVNYVAGYYRR
jgi:glycosyltransferase involved in cell wall biosynthesis